MRSHAALALLIVLVGAVCECRAQARYLGRELGALSELHHGVRGRVFAVDARTIYIHDFHYDGEGPAAFFYVGTSKSPSATGGIRLRDERGGTGPLRRYRGEGVALALPEGRTLRDLRWFSVWCDEYSVNFGDVSIPRDVEFPRPAKLGALRGVHGVSSDPVVVVDAQTLLVPNFSYDGEAPDAKFWVGRGDKPSPAGIRIPDENGKEAPLRKYDRKTIVLTLPGDLTVFDIGHFGVWCEAFTVNFGHVPLPRDQIANVPPSLKMLGVSPQSKLNCEVLLDELAFEVRWAVAGDSIVLQLVAKLEEGEYMSFGLSGDAAHSQMVGADVVVAWVDKHTLKGYAVDYYLDAKSQCAGVRGSCPDERLGEKTNSVRLLNAALVNGYSIVTYQRALRAADELDRAVLTNASQPVVWALGPLNARQEVSYHHHFTKGDKLIEFGRAPVWNCPMPEAEEESRDKPEAEPRPQPARQPAPARNVTTAQTVIKARPVPTPAPVARATAWDIPAIQCYEPPDGVFYAQMGPTGGKQGYPAITGHVGWGISWYINGLLIPEVNVVRGRKYTFVVEGGSNPDAPARYHPFYITNDPVGGYFHKSDEEKEGVEIYAGVRRQRNGELVPTGVGRLCNWTPDQNGPEADEYPSFGAYQRSLTLVCDEGNPGVVTWTPDSSTPDTVYYQCFTHRYLGWKINVLDECDVSGEESRLVSRTAEPEDLAQEESVQVHSRVKPDSNFIDQRKKTQKIINTKTNYNNFSSDKGGGGASGDHPEPPREQPHQEYEPPISTSQIRDVIEAVENLESRMKQGMRQEAVGAASELQVKARGPRPHQYQVYENTEGAPERPLRDGDEYVVEGPAPSAFFLPHERPLTLQSVLRPAGPARPGHNTRPPFRRPVPPEIKLRRPPAPQNHGLPQNQGGNGFPLPMPNAHGPHGILKKPYIKNAFLRYPGVNRPPPGAPPGTPPMKPMPPLHHPKPAFNTHNQGQFNQEPPKQMQNSHGGPGHSKIMNKLNPGNNVQLPSQSQTLSLGRTDLIANQVVKSQITLPGHGDVVAQSSAPQVFVNQPGQIILGKPMDNPMPLDQQMTPSKHYMVKNGVTSPPATSSPPTTQRVRVRIDQDTFINSIKSSDSSSATTFAPTLLPAVNTGFKPNTIVIESGFKPIIREPLMERVQDYDEINSNRREDTDVMEDYEQQPPYHTNQVYTGPSEKHTESFEPMFIPSPPDHLISTNDRTKEIFPNNHAKEERPHPVYVKTEGEQNGLFSKQNMDKEVPSDMVMESDRVSPQYLPPDPKLSKEQSQKLTNDEQTFTTYDGKTVSGTTLTSVSDTKPPAKLFSSKLPPSTEQLLKSPQFRPFKGEIPPPVYQHISKSENKNNQKTNNNDTKATQLFIVNVNAGQLHHLEDALEAAGSQKIEIKEKPVVEEPEELEGEESRDYITEDDGSEEEDYDEEKRQKRDTKATQFERGVAEEQVALKNESLTKNHIDFDSHVAISRSTKLHWTNLILLTLCLRFL